MMNRRLVRSALLLSILLASVSAPLQAVELYEEKKISQIQIELDSPGTTNFDPKPILSKLKTKEGDEFSQFTFDNDLKALSEEYDKVQPILRVNGDRLTIVIQVTPKPVIHQIRFQGNERYSTSSLMDELEIKPFTVFNRQEFNKAFNKVKEFYIKKGYFESQLSYTIEPIAGTNEIDISIDVSEGKSGKIKSIQFNGFSREEESEIYQQMYLKQYNFATSWLTGTGILRDEALEQDRMTIVNFLHNRGYADARVDLQIHEDPNSDKINIYISVDRGLQYRFGQIAVEGNELISKEDLSKRVDFLQGAVFSPDKLRDSAQAIKDLYGHKGYIDASVQYETRLKEDEPIFDVDFSIDEGQQYKIGMVHIFGNHSTQNNVILRESLLVPGETFDSRKLKATQQRLEGIGYFKSVNVYAVRTADDIGLGDNYRDVYVEVEETTTGNVSLFMGFSSTDSVFGGLDLTERNFNIAGVKDVFRGRPSALRGGGQYLHIRATLGKKQENVLISWMNPYVNDSLWRLGVELSQTFSDLQSSDAPTKTYGGSLFANYPLSNYWTVGVRERLRHTSNRIEINDTPVTAEDFKQQSETHGFLSGFSGNIAYDSTDSSVKPHSGWRSYGEAELAGVGGKYHFWKFSYLNSIYFPVSKRTVLKFRGELRFISPFGSKTHAENVPYSERFFLGGEGTVRGYKPFILGPQFPEAGEKYSGVPVGGLSSCLLSAEYNIEVFKLLDLFFFFDAGNVSFGTWHVHNLQCSAGGGIRLEINRGTPIVLGYGIPINPAVPHTKQKFFFSMGGQF